MSGYRTIKRGPMAADQFTQISNAVFRDPRLSAKAMGVFGHLSTHRAGYRVTPERIARFMKDGVSAIKGALRELEACGYLYRDRERRANGTLGSSTYFITDQPEQLDDALDPPSHAVEPGAGRPAARAGQKPRSEPEVGNPPVDCPPVDCPPVDCPPVENRALKNTKEEKTNSVPPSVPRARATNAAVEGRTDKHSPPLRGLRATSHRGEKVDRSPGVELLLRIGAQDSRYLLTGPTLRDQGAAVTALLAAGWTTQQVRQVVVGRPLPQTITTSIGAIVAQRISAALASPTPPAFSDIGHWTDEGGTGQTWTPPPVGDVIASVPRHAECDGDDGLCGRPAEPGYDKCAVCLGWVPSGPRRAQEGLEHR